jgi:hypothetical protein
MQSVVSGLPAQYVFVNDIPVEKQYVGWGNFGGSIVVQPLHVYSSIQIPECCLNMEEIFRRQKAIIGGYEWVPFWRYGKLVGGGREFVFEICGYKKGRCLSFVRDPKKVMPLQGVVWDYRYDKPRAFRINNGLSVEFGGFSSITRNSHLVFHCAGLFAENPKRNEGGDNSPNSNQDQENCREVCGRNYAAEIALRFAAGLN